jgi:hypothetical protein
MISDFPTRRVILVFLAMIVCISVVTVNSAEAGEFPNKTTKEKLPNLQGQTTKGSEKLPAAETPQSKGGCLIATATYGTELAPEVQQLREIRDRVFLTTGSGTAFLNAFNDVYYSFSPTVADWERENPVFKEMVKVAIMPMLSTLSILNYVGIDSEQEMLGYGIGIILLNIGMYFVGPACLIFGCRKLLKNSKKIRGTN